MKKVILYVVTHGRFALPWLVKRAKNWAT